MGIWSKMGVNPFNFIATKEKQQHYLTKFRLALKNNSAYLMPKNIAKLTIFPWKIANPGVDEFKKSKKTKLMGTKCQISTKKVKFGTLDE